MILAGYSFIQTHIPNLNTHLDGSVLHTLILLIKEECEVCLINLLYLEFIN